MTNKKSYYYFRETKGFQCWEYENGIGAKSRLYIPKWRIPEKIPHIVNVGIRTKNDYLPETIISKNDAFKMPEIKLENIVIMADIISEHTYTVRYDARNYNKQIHSLYIPHSFFDNNIFPESVQIIVEWN